MRPPLDSRIKGTTADAKYDQLKVTKTASLDGTLNISLGSGFTPTVGQSLTLLTASSVSDTFSTVIGLAINTTEYFKIACRPGSVVLTGGATRPDICLKPMLNGAPERVTGGPAANDEPALSARRPLAGLSFCPPAGRHLSASLGYSPGPAARRDCWWKVGSPALFAEWRMGRLSEYRRERRGRGCGQLEHAVLRAGAGRRPGATRQERIAGAGRRMERRQPERPFLDNRRTWCASAVGRSAQWRTGRKVLGEFLVKPALRAGRYSIRAAPSRLEMSGCTASTNGTVLADEVDNRSGRWVLPVDAESGAVRGSIALLTPLGTRCRFERLLVA